MHLIQFGTGFYLIDGKKTYRLTYPQYRTFLELDRGDIEPDQYLDRVKYYEEKEVVVSCPYCQLYLSRGTVEYLGSLGEADREQYHSFLAHHKGGPIPFSGEAAEHQREIGLKGYYGV
jgi:hypothetical protein